MAEPLIIEFKLPEFRAPGDELKTALEAILNGPNDIDKRKQLALDLGRQVTELGSGIMRYESQHVTGQYFRSYASDWHFDDHLDYQNPSDEDIAIITTSSPALYAGGLVEIDGDFAEYAVKNNISEAVAPREIAIETISRTYGLRWLQTLAGPVEDTKLQRGLRGVVIGRDLVIQRAPDMSIAQGKVGETFHQGTPRKKSEPTSRIIGVYSIPRHAKRLQSIMAS